MYKYFDDMQKRDYIDEEWQKKCQLYYFALSNAVMHKYI